MSPPVRSETLPGVWQRPYTRTVRGQTRVYAHGARSWTADDYDLIEKLIAFNLSCTEIGRYFDMSGEAVRCAMVRADIPRPRVGKHRPSNEERAKWAKIWKLWKAGEL